MDSGSPMKGVIRGGWKVPSPLPRRAATLFRLSLASRLLGLPSSLTSTMSAQIWPLPSPASKFRAVWNVPSPLPSSTETEFASELATTRSSLPSPLRSPAATEYGPDPTAYSLAGAGRGNPQESKDIATTSSDTRQRFVRTSALSPLTREALILPRARFHEYSRTGDFWDPFGWPATPERGPMCL